jgi:hypothetical protein
MATYTDDFNRSNSGTLGANWTVLSSTSGSNDSMAVSSNQCIYSNGSDRISAVAYNNSFNADQYSQYKMVISDSSGGFSRTAAVATRMSGGPPTYSNGYLGGSTTDSAAVIYLFLSGSYTLLQGGMATFSANDILKMTSIGSTHTLYRNGSSQGSASDGSISAANPSGIRMDCNAPSGAVPTIDDWEGGDPSAASGWGPLVGMARNRLVAN